MFEENRKIYAEITIDEDTMLRNAEVNGLGDPGDIGMLEHEFGWLEQSGFGLGYARIADADEDDPYEAYLNYLIDFAFSHPNEDGDRDSPLSYHIWRRNKSKSAGKIESGKKIIRTSPASAALALISDLGCGEPTENRDRTSRYLEIGCNRSDMSKKISICLIEEKNYLEEKDWGYSVHIIDDASDSCKMISTDELSTAALEKALQKLFSDLGKGNPV